jgi:hypothetical protein
MAFFADNYQVLDSSLLAGSIHQLYLQKYNPNMDSDISLHWWLYVEHKSCCNTERTCAEKWEPIEGMGTENSIKPFPQCSFMSYIQKYST